MKIKNTRIKVIEGDVKDLYPDLMVNKISGDEVNEFTVREAYRQGLEIANKEDLNTVAFTAIGCLNNQFPVVGSAKIATQEIFKFLKADVSVKQIVFCIADQENCKLFEESMFGYFDHLINTLGPGPYVTVDILIRIQDSLVLIERSNPPYGWALPGGFVDYGESLEQAAAREAKEETNLDLENLKQFHAYSALGRDPRFQTVTTVFTADGVGDAQFGDDAKGLKVVPLNELLNLEYAFDHKEIIEEYLQTLESVNE